MAQLGAQQYIGFSPAGGSTSVPDYTLPTTQFTLEQSSIYDTEPVNYGNRDNVRNRDFVGHSENTLSFTIRCDDKYFPILLLNGMSVSSSENGTTGQWDNILIPDNQNTQLGTMTFFGTEAGGGTFKYTNAMVNEISTSIGTEAIEVEFEVYFEDRIKQTGTDETDILNAFSGTNDETRFRYGNFMFEYSLDNGNNYTALSSQPDASITVTHNVNPIVETYSSSSEFAKPTNYRGAFTSSYEIERVLRDSNLTTAYLAGTPLKLRITAEAKHASDIGTSSIKPTIIWEWDETAFNCQTGDVAADSSEPVLETISAEQVNARNTYSLTITVKNDTDLSSI